MTPDALASAGIASRGRGVRSSQGPVDPGDAEDVATRTGVHRIESAEKRSGNTRPEQTFAGKPGKPVGVRAPGARASSGARVPGVAARRWGLAGVPGRRRPSVRPVPRPPTRSALPARRSFPPRAGGAASVDPRRARAAYLPDFNQVRPHEASSGRVRAEAFARWAVSTAPLFQTGWFVDSVISRTLILLPIRTQGVPFIRSRARWPLTATTQFIVAPGAWSPWSPARPALGCAHLPLRCWPLLALAVPGHALLTLAVRSCIDRRGRVSGGKAAGGRSTQTAAASTYPGTARATMFRRAGAGIARP